MQRRILILITANFPYGYGEPYLESEIPFLAERFDKILIISNGNSAEFKRDIPENIEILEFAYLPVRIEKLRSITGIFEFLFWEELFRMIFRQGVSINYSRIASILGAIYTGKKLSRFIVHWMEETKMNKLSKVYAYSYWCNNMAVGLALLKRDIPDIVGISRAHGYDVYFHRNEINFLPMRHLIYKTLDRIYFVSSNGLQYTRTKVGNYSSFQLSRLGVKPIELNSINKDNDKLTIISCSSIIRLKRITLIVESLSLIDDIQIHWIHLGSGPLLKTVHQLAHDLLSEKGNINYEFPGQMSNKEVLEFYSTNKTDVLINVSESEGLPVSIVEAMAARMTIIATDVGGTNEIVQNNYNGLLLAKEATPITISQSIRYIRKNLNILKENAYLTWKSGFDATKTYPSFVQELIELMPGDRTTP